MNKNEALELASIAYEMLLASYGFTTWDSGNFERMFVRLIADQKVKNWLPYFLFMEKGTEEREVMATVFKRHGIEVLEDEESSHP